MVVVVVVVASGESASAATANQATGKQGQANCQHSRQAVNQLLRPFALLESPLCGVRPHRVALIHSLYKSDTYVKAMPDHKQTNSAAG